MEIKYEEKIVAFIDVLGFSNLVYTDKIEPICQYYEMILSDFKKAASKNDVKFLMISDSIVVHTPLDRNDFFNIVKLINTLQHRLLIKGILIRGGISFGNLFVNEVDNIIVGTGLVNAYKLELLASYPRIIIDRRFINLFWTDTNKFIMGTGHLIKFAAPLPYLQDYPFLDIGQAVAMDFQPKKFQSIVTMLKVNYYNNEHIGKYEWLKCNISDSVNKSLNYLESKSVKTKNEIKRIRLLTDFITEFEQI